MTSCPTCGQHVPAKGLTRYPIADSLRHNERATSAVRTGEFRDVQEGEWYLSGAIPEAYRAHGHLQGPFHILRLLPAQDKDL